MTDAASEPTASDAQRLRVLLAYALARGRGLTTASAYLRELGAAQGIPAREFDRVGMLEELLDRAATLDPAVLQATLLADAVRVVEAAPTSRSTGPATQQSSAETAQAPRKKPKRRSSTLLHITPGEMTLAQAAKSAAVHRLTGSHSGKGGAGGGEGAFPPHTELPESVLEIDEGAEPGVRSGPSPPVLTDSGGRQRVADDAGSRGRPYLGPFEIIGVLERQASASLLACRDEPTGRAVSVRLLPPASAPTAVRSYILSRFVSLDTHGLPWPGSLVRVFGVDAFTRQPAVGSNPARLRRLKDAAFGLLEEPRSGWTAGRVWLAELARQPPGSSIRMAVLVRELVAGLAFLARGGLAHGRLTVDSLARRPGGSLVLIDWLWAASLLRRDDSERAPSSAGTQRRAGPLGAATWFLAPEVFLGNEEGRQPADQYACGVLLYRLVAGQLPPEWARAGNLMQSIQAIERGIETRPRSLNPGVGAALDRAILRATAVRPADRFASLAEFQDALDEALADAGVTRLGVRRAPPASATPAPTAYAKIPAPTRAITHARPPRHARRPLPGLHGVPTPAALDPAGLAARLPDAYEFEAIVHARPEVFVLRVRHRQTHTRFALKLYRVPDEPTLGLLVRRQFEVEHKYLRRCQHDGIVALQEVGECGPGGGDRYVVLEWAPGWQAGDRPAWLALDALPCPLPEAVVLWIGPQLTRALAICHDVGVVHYDLAPGNCLLFARGEIKLADFQSANAPRAYGDLAPGARLGTPGYMGPEHDGSAGAPCPEADCFGLGAILFELLTGVRPYPEHEAAFAADQPLPPWGAPPDARDWVSCSDELATLLVRLLRADDGGRRLRSATQAEQALRAAIREPIAWPALAAQLGSD